MMPCCSWIQMENIFSVKYSMCKQMYDHWDQKHKPAQLLVCAFISPDLNRDVLISQLFNNNNKKTPKTLWFNESWQKVNTLHMLPLCKRDTCEIPTWQAAITIDFHLTAAILQTVWFMLCEVILKTTSTTRACTCAKVDIIENLAIKHDLAWYDIIYACFS